MTYIAFINTVDYIDNLLCFHRWICGKKEATKVEGIVKMRRIMRMERRIRTSKE